MKPLSFIIRTLGCKVNQYDGAQLAKILVNMGCLPISQGAPDLYILNSCTVTARSAQKVRQELRSARKRWPNAKIFLAGCEAKLQKDGGIKTVEADAIILPSASETDLQNLFESVGISISNLPIKKIDDPVFTHGLPETNNEKISPNSRRTRAFLKIQDGCSQFCSYCIVPFIRNKEISRPINEVLAEANSLAREGFREIVLTGIHLGRYQFGLHSLLHALQDISGFDRIRLSSIEPQEVQQPLIDWLLSSSKSCHHLHIPLQAGCDKILSAMKRPYDIAYYRELVLKIREKLPDLALTTDLIVGFPGETEDDFGRSLGFVEEMQFSRIHIFRYSQRPGTLAASFPQQISESQKRIRASLVEKLSTQLSNIFYQRFIHRNVEVLWENFKSGVWKGYSREYIPCNIEDESSHRKNRVEVVQLFSVDEKGAWCRNHR